ncbi:MAG: malate dehydrogenase [Dissulfurispiraceae bacterium]
MNKKVSIIGAGNVGASLAHMVVQSGIADVSLFDVVEGVPQGKALDLAEACPLWGSASSIKGTNDYADTADSDLIVITAGFPRKPGMSRDDLLNANAKVVSDVTKNTTSLSPQSIVIVVTNPMDVMAQLSMRVSGFAPRRVVGMGGILDSARFRTFVAWQAGVSPQDVEALVLGGHGDLMTAFPWSATINGVPISELMSKETIDAIVQRTRQGGAEIIGHLKTGSAFYAPAAATFQMVKSIILDEKRLLPCAAYLNGEYEITDVYTGVPVILGSRGVDMIIEFKLSEEEKREFNKSVSAVKSLLEKLQV